MGKSTRFKTTSRPYKSAAKKGGDIVDCGICHNEREKDAKGWVELTINPEDVKAYKKHMCGDCVKDFPEIFEQSEVTIKAL